MIQWKYYDTVEFKYRDTVETLLSCMDNDYSLVDSLIFIDSQDYRYRTCNRCINGYHTDESHMDEVEDIALVVESEKGLFWVTAVA